MPAKGMTRGLAVFSAFAVTAAWGTEASAQLFEGARLLSLSEAQRALTTSHDSIYVNPGGLALAQVYSVELGYLDDFRGSDRKFNASIVDSQAGPVAAGLAYTYGSFRPDGMVAGNDRLQGHRLEASTAVRLSNTSAFGMTSRYITYDYMNGETEDEAKSFSLFTLDVGLQWRLSDTLSFGLVGYNLLNSDQPEVPISWGAGLGYLVGTLSIELDVRYNAKIGGAKFSAGAGYVVGELLPLRIGGAYDRKTGEWSISGGIGIIVDNFAIDVGYRQTLNPELTGEDADNRIFAVAMRTLFL